MNNAIILRPLGRTDMMVTPIGLGCWQFSKQNNFVGKFWPVLDNDTVNKIVTLSLEGGINWFDTAEVYGNGASEKALSEALLKAGKKPGDVLVATKWWPGMRFASSIGKTINDRVSSLSPFPIDLHQVHQSIGFSGAAKEMEEMALLYEKTLIKHIGVSNHQESRMRKAWETLGKKNIPLATNQMPYSLLNRKIESNGVMSAAKELGITIIAYSPLAQGLLTGKFHDNPGLLNNIGYRKYMPNFSRKGMEKSLPVIKLVKELAEKYNVSTSQIALNWLINFSGNTVVAIPGATKESHVKENTGAMTFRLSEEDMDRLDKVSAIFK